MSKQSETLFPCIVTDVEVVRCTNYQPNAPKVSVSYDKVGNRTGIVSKLL